MAADVNYDVKTGRLTKDVEAKEINGTYLMTGCIAVNRSYKKGDQWIEEASFFNFKTWIKSEKQKDYYVSRLKKGTQVTIDGEIIQEHWEKDGQKQSVYVLMANRIVPPYTPSNGSGNTSGSKVPSFDSAEGFPEDFNF